MTFIDIEGMSSGYATIVRRTLGGEKVSPRGLGTRELTDAVITVHDPLDALPVGTGRGLNLAIAAVEALQLVGEISIPELNIKASRNFSQFTEPDGTFWGAYGNRARGQLAHVHRKLRDDPDTRQAVITLWDPQLDNDSGHKDYPCTLSLVFRIRRGKLDLSVTMRSNDVILGLAYDVFQFTQLQITLARALRVEVGRYVHHALSLHIYERDMEMAEAIHDNGTPLRLAGFGSRHTQLHEAQARARLIAGGTQLIDPTFAESWYWEQVRSIKSVPDA